MEARRNQRDDQPPCPLHLHAISLIAPRGQDADLHHRVWPVRTARPDWVVSCGQKRRAETARKRWSTPAGSACRPSLWSSACKPHQRKGLSCASPERCHVSLNRTAYNPTTPHRRRRRIPRQRTAAHQPKGLSGTICSTSHNPKTLKTLQPGKTLCVPHRQPRGSRRSRPSSWPPATPTAPPPTARPPGAGPAHTAVFQRPDSEMGHQYK